MPRFYLKTTNNMKDQASVFSPKTTSPVEMFAKENYPVKLQDMECQRTIINIIKEFEGVKEGSKKHLSEIK